MNTIKNHYIECDCSTDEHTLRFAYDDVEKEVYFSTYLHHWKPWYKRVWVGIKYVFGHTSKYGHFDNTVMSGEQLHTLRNLMDQAISDQKKA